MYRTAEEFQQAAKEKNITSWPIHDCSICGYHCGYKIIEDSVAYDSGCDCVSYIDIQPRSWEDIAHQYNMQDHPGVIDKMDQFWGFAPPSEEEKSNA